MPQQQISTEEIIRRGEEIHERDLKARYDTPENRGKFLVIDVNSGDCDLEQRAGEATAAGRLLARRPNALLYFARVGCSAGFDLFGFMDSPER